MYARIATFEGGDPGGFDKMATEMSAGGPPEDVPATGFFFLIDRATGKSLAVVLFDSEADLEAGSAALDAMTPPVAGVMGRRTSVEKYEVAFHMAP